MPPTYDVKVNFDPSATSTAGPLVGVLALQGDVQEHVRALQASGAHAVLVRRPAELAGLDGLVIPGGESTTMDKLSRSFGLREPLRERIGAGLPVYGSCAGMIMLAEHLVDPALDLAGQAQQTLGGLDITVRRNAFGRQVDSFETQLDFRGLAAPGQPDKPLHAVFIRAPWVERVGTAVEVLATVTLPQNGHNAKLEPVVRAVAVRSRHLLATSFHPEVTGERRIHELFIRMIKGEA